MKSFLAKRKKMFARLFYLYFSNAFSSLLGLVTVLVLANFLDRNEYGNYKYIYSVMGILTALSLGGGLRQTIIQSVAKGFDGILTNIFKKNLFLSVPMIVGGVGLGAYYLIQGNFLLGITLPIVTLGTVFANNGTLAASYLIGRSLFKELFILQAVIGVINILVLLLMIFIVHDIQIIIISTSITVAFVSTILFFFVRKKLSRTKDAHPEIWKYGKHLNVLSIFSTIQQNIDSILVFGLLGSAPLAIYAMATPFVDRLLGFVKATYQYVLPKFTQSGPEQAFLKFYERTLVCFGFGLAIYIAYVISIPHLFKIFFPQYLDSISLSILFALNIPIAALTLVPQAYIDSLIEIKNKYIINGCQFVIRIVTLPFGIYWFGVEGVIYSELFTRIIGAGITVCLVEKSRRTLIKI